MTLLPWAIGAVLVAVPAVRSGQLAGVNLAVVVLLPLALYINWRLAILLFILCVVFTVLTTLVVIWMAFRFVDGTTILASDLQAICEVPAMDYRPGDTFEIDGAPATIIQVRNIPEAGTRAAIRFWIASRVEK